MAEISVTEIIPLITNERTDVRLQSLQIAAQIVNSTNVAELCADEIFTSLLSSLDHTDLRVHTATLIINIIAEQGEISQTNLIMEKVVNFLKEPSCPRENINMYLILLANLTISQEVCEHFINYCAKTESSQILIDRFLAYNPQTVEGDEVQEDYSESDVWQYFSSVLCNLCRLESGRRLILAVSTGNMAGCFKQVRSKNPIRRRGVVACIRSCLFNSDIHWWMVVEMNVIPVLLLPLVTETEFTEAEKVGMEPILWMQGPNKKPDPETDIQKMLLECLQLLGQKRGMREEMRKRKVYPICRNLDYLQDNEEISAIIYEIVQLTMGDEDPDTPKDVVKKMILEDGTHVVEGLSASGEVVKQVEKKKKKVMSGAGAGAGAGDDAAALKKVDIDDIDAEQSCCLDDVD